ncbi:MAG: BlaI/MecI/CopY family transcriptional regulator [Caulobacteraceae bacterium]|nr:BlaI/MecI/CopY family transcriptional regulator [Caulobacteraceae bacterium]
MSDIRITTAESQVMQRLWLAAPQTAEQLSAYLGPLQGWTDTTLKTLLGRLLAKGAVSATRDGRRYLYSPVVQRTDYVAAESDGFIERMFDGEVAPMVLHFAERRRITRRDAAEIRRLLDTLEEED